MRLDISPNEMNWIQTAFSSPRSSRSRSRISRALRGKARQGIRRPSYATPVPRNVLSERSIPARELRSTRQRLHTPSLCGFERSNNAPRTANNGILAMDAIALMGRLGIERFAAVGHDWGSTTAEALAIGWPDRVSELALLSSMPRMGPGDASLLAPATRLVPVVHGDEAWRESYCRRSQTLHSPLVSRRRTFRTGRQSLDIACPANSGAYPANRRDMNSVNSRTRFVLRVSPCVRSQIVARDFTSMPGTLANR